MKNSSKGKHTWLLILQALFLGVLAFVFCYNDILFSLDSLYRDNAYQRSRGVNQSIKIIAIDEKTLNEYGPYGTWDRSVYADVIDTLGEYPAVIGFDILFISEMTKEGDARLLESAQKNGNVVFASHIDFDTVVRTDEEGKQYLDSKYVRAMEMPFSGDAVTTGYVNVSADNDGIVRRTLPTFMNKDTNEFYTGFSYQIYKSYCEKKGIPSNTASTDGVGNQWIYYAGKPFDYEAVSMSDLLSGKVDPRVFTDCIVLVGAYANGLQDQFSVPNSANEMFGVEINANILQGYLDNTFPVPVNRFVMALITGLMVFVLFLLFSKLRLKWGSVLFVVMEVLVVFLGIILFTKADLILPGVYLLIFIFLDYVFALIVNYISEWLSKRKIASAFRKYVAPQVVDGIMKTGEFQVKLGGENRDIAVLFVDIRGFTPLSESLKPEQVVEILNEYLNLTTSSIFKNSGTLDKFIGDATMAVFNAPFDLKDYEMQALRTAKDIVSGAKALEKSCMDRFGKKVAFGVGVNCGEAVVGNIGCDFRMDYTAIGDTVNTAARLEANAKAGQVLISEYIYERVKDKGVKVEPIGEIPLKGKSKGVFVYQLTEIDGEKVGGES
ncbi:MAG: adenylate/guanylate cyclase domain-containing protein [Lachnospiraceae bacterium]|nr:adenylate/guanylate cyclase domain-containing protein [Lachnospiraceae bacterium]